jgi:hypothetical protein
MLEWVLIDEALEMPCKCTRHWGGATSTGALQQALGTVLGKALDPWAEGRIRHVEQRGTGLEVVARDDLADGLRAAKDPRVLRRFAHGVSRRQRLSAQVACEGTHGLAPWRRMTDRETLLIGAKRLRLKFPRFCL